MKKTSRKSLALSCILFFAPWWIVAQNIHLRSYTNKDGLCSDFIQCLYQDSKGYLWLGTEHGLSRFDGYQFTNIYKSNGLPTNSINAIGEDNAGNTWVSATNSGVSRISGNQIKNFSILDGLPHNHVTSIYKDKKGLLWFTTHNGLGYYDGQRFHSLTTNIIPINMFFCMTADKHGNFWLGSRNGLILFKNNRFSRIPWAHSLDNIPILSILHDSQGRIWLGSSRGLTCYHHGSLTIYKTDHGLGANCITSIIEDGQGRIWAGTWNGVGLFTGKGFINYTNQNGLPDNMICHLLLDQEKNIWIATAWGVCRLNTMNVLTYSTKEGLPQNMIMDIAEDQHGRYWVGTPEGLACLENNQFKLFTTKDGLIHNYIQNLTIDPDNILWISTIGGLSQYANGTFTNYTTQNGLSDNNIIDVFKDSKASVWICLRKKIQLLKNGKFLSPPFSTPLFTAVHIIEDSKANLWFAALEGLFLYSGNQLTQYTQKDGLPDARLNYILQDRQNNYWIATDSGLVSFSNQTFKTYTVHDGLPDNNCFFIIEDNTSQLWIGTANGISCFNGNHFKNFTMESHDLVSRFWKVGFKDSQGDIWLGSNDGITRFTLPPFPVNTTPPPIHITAVKGLEKNIPLHNIPSPQLNYHENYIHFEFTGISFSAPKSITYKYQLSNLEKNWKSTKDRSIFYPYLPPGDYTFNVKAINADGYESTDAASFDFQVLPPFWQTWWFRGILLIVISSLLTVFFLWHLRRVREKEIIKAQQRELKARNQQLVMSQRMELLGTLAAGAVHDLKNLLTVIIGYSRIAARTPDKTDTLNSSIENIKNTANSAVNVVSQILAFTRQQHNTLLHVNLPDLLDETLTILNVTRPANIKITYHPPQENIPLDINPTHFCQLAMNICLNAFQAMTNGGQLTITLEKLPGQRVAISFTDTGPGIPQENLSQIFNPFFTTKIGGKGTGLGLFVVKQIVEEYHGTIDVISSPPQGTRFIITLPQ